MEGVHNCLDHLVLRESRSIETHGLDCGPYEVWEQEWYECAVCRSKYEQAEVDQMWAEEATR